VLFTDRFWVVILLMTSATELVAGARPGSSDGVPDKLGKLKIVPLDGNGAVNDIKRNTAAQVVVEVRDDSDRPVSGASVSFELPTSGPSGTFPDQSTIQHVVSNTRGQAGTTGMVPNGVAGRFVIRVTAALNDISGSATITQINSAIPLQTPTVAQPRSRPWKWLALTGAGAAGVGIALARRSGGSSNTPAAISIVITPGPVTVGGPR
jgi:hypothetical protein